LPDADKDAGNVLVGEAKFLRAFFYFNLERIFGHIPLVLTPLAPTVRPPQAIPDSVYAQIERDLLDAVDVLPEKSEVTDIGRATRGAANGLLTKVYIYDKKWSAAKAAAAAVINSGEYSLEDNYSDIFLHTHNDGRESVFDIEYTYDPSGGYGSFGNTFTTFRAPRENYYYTGYGFDCPTDSFAAAFEPGDIRKKATILSVGDTLFAGTSAEVVVDKLSNGNPTGKSCKKYLADYASPQGEANVPNNWREIRYADILLFYDEAANELGSPDFTFLNMVRDRAKLPPLTTAGLTKDQIRAKIFHERRVELGLEGHRYFDLMRASDNGTLTSIQNQLPATFSATKTKLPIPQQAKELNGNLTVDNPY
jgi:hypothetical protein